MSDDSEASIAYVRKRLYVTDKKAPALSVDRDGYVRCGLSAEMTESDMVVLGLVLALKNEDWKKALVERVKKKLEGAGDDWKKIERAFQMLKE